MLRLFFLHDYYHRQFSKYRNDTIMYLAGTFDLLHFGYLECIREAKIMGDVLVVSVETDKATKASKGKSRPIIGEQQRVALIDCLRPVSYSLVNELRDYDRYPTQLNVIRRLRHDVFAATPHDDRWTIPGKSRT